MKELIKEILITILSCLFVSFCFDFLLNWNVYVPLILGGIFYIIFKYSYKILKNK